VKNVKIIVIKTTAKVSAYGFNCSICSNTGIKYCLKVSPEYIPVRILIKVIPICTVDKNFVGELDKLSTETALLSPFFEAISSFVFRDEIKAISAIENKPLRRIRRNIIINSIKKRHLTFKHPDDLDANKQNFHLIK
jgi:hypothetical protein